MPAIHPTHEDRRKAAHRIDASRVWAVLIGINVYPFSDSYPLHGCVNDVEKMAEFLINDLRMSEGRIQCLLGTSPGTSNLSIDTEEGRVIVDVTNPTRKNIVDTLFDLSTNPEIHHGDNIIIYFAGHGSTYSCSDIYDAKEIAAIGNIEALCPMDRTAPKTGVAGIPDISDREINTLLAEISRAKGHHITCILDCCHSSGATRVPTTQQDGVRGATPLPSFSVKDVLDAAHTRLRDLPEYASVYKGDWKPDMTSHVLLAACPDYQQSTEARQGTGSRCNGIFTRALIEALKSDDLKEESTYVDLICAVNERMSRNTMQMPVVAGNMGSRLWYQPQMSNKISSWSAMLILFLSVVGVGLTAWLRG